MINCHTNFASLWSL